MTGISERGMQMYYVGEKDGRRKPYKTLDGALKAAAKDEKLIVTDEEGMEICNLMDDSLEGEEMINEEVKDETAPQREQMQAEQESKPEEKEEKPEFATVILKGASLNLRRSRSWEPGNECGRATYGQRYRVKEVHEVDGKAMIETAEGLFLSGSPEHVRVE